MTKKELFKSVTIEVRTGTVFINNQHVSFMYNPVDCIKPEYREQYRYFGGLQSNYPSDSQEHKNIEKWCCELAESILKTI